MSRAERGVGTVLTAGIAAVTAVVAGASCLCITWFSTIRQAERVAEVAALAGASAAVRGDDPCAASKQAALRNGGALSRCVVRGEGPNVVVETGVVAHMQPHLGIVPEHIERLATAATV